MLRYPFVLGVLAVLALAAAACGNRISAQQEIRFADDQLHMMLPGDWEKLELGDPERTAFMHRSLPGVSLVLENEGFEWEGPPMPNTALRAMIGKELNAEYGRVTSRITFNRCALNSYPRERSIDGQRYATQNWVLSRLIYGDRFISRVAFSLRVPEAQQADPKIAALTEAMDEAIGNATITDPMDHRRSAH